MVILDEGENVQDAQKAGMMIGRRADLDEVRLSPSLFPFLLLFAVLLGQYN